MLSPTHKDTGISDNLSPHPVSEPHGFCLLHYDKLLPPNFSVISFLLYFGPCSPWESRQDRSPCCSRWHLVSQQPLHRIPILLEMPSTPLTLFILQKHIPSPAPLPAGHSFGHHCLFNTCSWLFSVPCTPPMFSTETCVVSKQNKSQSQWHFVPSILNSYNDREINTETAASLPQNVALPKLCVIHLPGG